MSKHLGLTALLAGLVLTAAAQAVPVIDVGNHELLENTPGQQIQLMVSGGDDVAGLNIFVGTGDGGELVGGIDGTAPAITGLDIVGPTTIFGANNTGQTTPDAFVQLWSAYTTTEAGYVTADGVLAVLTIDTTGFFFDSVVPSNNFHSLRLDWTAEAGVATDFGDEELEVTLIEGTIQIVAVPEPTAALLVLPLAGLVLRRRR